MVDNLFKSIAVKYDTDKSNGFYEKAYEESFFLGRNDIKLVFEIGVNRGGSIRTFRDYFPNALIVGIDVNPNTKFREERIEVEIGNATRKEFIVQLIEKYGQPDIVIDDGSHVSNEMRATYNLLYSLTKICYVIEDLGTQYLDFEGGKYIKDTSMVTTLYQKVDELMQNKLVSSIKFYHSICFMFKERIK